MIKTEIVNIGEHEYVITTFDAIKGNLILFKLLKYLRGSASLLDNISLDNIASSFLDSDVKLGTVLENAISNIDPNDMNQFVISLLQNVTFSNKIMDNDLIKHHFAGNYVDMYRLIIAVIKANYANEATNNFFSKVRENKSKVMADTNTKNTKAG